jgi:hypothetical protein
MDERPPLYRRLLVLLWLPLALALVLPAVLLLGVAYYLRAAVMALTSLARFAGGDKTPPPASTQPPHIFEIGVPAKKKNNS